MINKLITIGILMLSTISINAQNNKAKNILDKTASAIRNAGDITAVFTAISSNQTMSGTVYIHKNMLHLQSDDIKCWYDGKTLWAYRKNTEEVHVTTPTPSEQQSINPYLFINIYKKGYRYTSKEVTLHGKKCHEVTLIASSPTNKLRKMIVTVDKNNFYPIRVDMIRSKNSTTIDIKSYKIKQNFSPTTFKFNKSDYPGAEIIDMR